MGTRGEGVGFCSLCAPLGYWTFDYNIFIHSLSSTAVRFCSPQWGLTSLMKWHKTSNKVLVRAIEASHAACRDEFGRNPRSHGWRFFILWYSTPYTSMHLTLNSTINLSLNHDWSPKRSRPGFFAGFANMSLHPPDVASRGVTLVYNEYILRSTCCTFVYFVGEDFRIILRSNRVRYLVCVVPQVSSEE